jgi:hypothetical protein
MYSRNIILTKYVIYVEYVKMYIYIYNLRITNANRPYYELLPLPKSQSTCRAEKIKICKTLIRPVATHGPESWTLNKDIIIRLAVFETKVLRRMFGGIKVNENWRKRYNKKLMQPFGDLDMLHFSE